METITKENSLHFVLKKEFFEKIKSGEKTHEYRLFTPHWNKRILHKNSAKSGKYLTKPKKYAKFSLGMTKDPNKNMVFEIKNITLVRADQTELVKIYPALKNSNELAHDVELGKRII